MIAVRERDAGVVGHSRKRGHAGHDLERNFRVVQALGFFATATEHVGVATFEAHDGFAFAGFGDELFDDVGAIVFGVFGSTSPEKNFCFRGREFEQGKIYQRVIDDDIGTAE